MTSLIQFIPIDNSGFNYRFAAFLLAPVQPPQRTAHIFVHIQYNKFNMQNNPQTAALWPPVVQYQEICNKIFV